MRSGSTPDSPTKHGDMVERVDTLVSKTSSLIESVGSSPSVATIKNLIGAFYEI